MNTRRHDDLTGWTETPGARFRHLTRDLAASEVGPELPRFAVGEKVIAERGAA